MKKWMMLVLLATCTLGAQAADREMKAANDTLVVTTTPQMHCANCEKKIKDHIRFVKGTKKIETSVPKQTVSIVYDPQKTNVEAYRNAKLLVTRDQAVKLKENEYFIADLIGLSVISDEGEELGELSDVLSTGANDVYVVEKENTKDLLIPAIRECIRNVDLEQRVMTVHLLPGLREEN